MVVFGAGASYDCVNRKAVTIVEPLAGVTPNYRPPLATELFADRPNFGKVIEEFREAAGLVGHLRRRVLEGGHVEEELERVRNEAYEAGDEGGLIELAAVQFYLQQIIYDCGEEYLSRAHGVTVYHELIRRLRQWRARHKDELVLLCTFNYDTLLEHACQIVGFAPLTLDTGIEKDDSYIQREDFKIIKLHGSVDWGHNVPNPERSGFGHYRQAQHFLIQNPKLVQRAVADDTYVFVREPPHILNNAAGPWPFPALALPTTGNKSFECPELHLKAIQDRVEQATRLLVIGWRGMEKHFLAMLDGNLPDKLRTLIVAGRGKDPSPAGAPGDEVVERLRAAGVPGDIVNAVCGFSGLLGSDALESFLSD